MPPVAAAAIAASSAVASGAIGVALFLPLLTAGIGSVGFFVAATGVVAAPAVNALGSRLLAKKPKAQQFTQDAAGRTLMIRSSVESHKIIYGRPRVSGPIVFIKSADSGPDQLSTTQTGVNKFLHMVNPSRSTRSRRSGTSTSTTPSPRSTAAVGGRTRSTPGPWSGRRRKSSLSRPRFGATTPTTS
jgi:hypothetical protein